MATNKKKKVEEMENEDLEEELDNDADDSVVIGDEDEGIKSLDQVVKEFEQKYKSSKVIDQDEFLDATSYLDLSDDDYEKVFERFKKAGFELTGGEKDTDLDDVDIPDNLSEEELVSADDDYDDIDLEDNEESQIDVNNLENFENTDVKVNDSVKLYLKEAANASSSG